MKDRREKNIMSIKITLQEEILQKDNKVKKSLQKADTHECFSVVFFFLAFFLAVLSFVDFFLNFVVFL